MASLIVTTGVNKGDYYPLGQRTTIIGRDEAIPVQIIDRKISRKHMKIRFEDGKFYAVDMESKHGVFVNGIQVDNEMLLVDNDYILIGQTILLFTMEDFDDRENALYHFKKVGERQRPTITDSALRTKPNEQ